MSTAAVAAPAAQTMSAAAAGRTTRPANTEAWKNAAGHAAAAGTAMIFAALVLQLWRADLTAPLFDKGDSLFHQLCIRNVQDTGWFLDNPRLGAPGALDLRDFPQADALHYMVIKLLLCVFRDPAIVFNLFILLPFPLTALSSYFVCRRLRLCRLASLVPSVLYASMPYHFLRMQCHIFLAAYYLLPPMLWLALRVWSGRSPLLRSDPGGPPRWRLRSWEAAGAMLLCVLTGLAGVYYAFFSSFFLTAAGAAAAWRQRRYKPALAAAVLVLLIAVSVAAALSPSLIHIAVNGRNPSVAGRNAGDADYFGMTIGELLMPIPQHRIPYLASLVRRYTEGRRPTGEWPYEPLGVVASVGFVYLVGRFMLRRRAGVERAEDGLAFLNLAAVLLGTVGGLGSCFAFWVSPMIRCYNRLSICIAFFALAGLSLVAQRLAVRFVRGPWSRAAWAAGLLAILALGALDQTSPDMTPPYAETRRQLASDGDFGRRMEATLPAGSMVYQAPYAKFPECWFIENLAPYEPLRPFLHTRTLRFSYGAMTGRWPDGRLADLAKRPTTDLVERLALVGFRGVYIDRDGFADHGAATEAELTRLLGAGPLVSLSGRQTFFDLSAYARDLHARLGDEQWEARSDATLYPVEPEWGGSFRGEEYGPEGRWRWCDSEGSLRLNYGGHLTKRVLLRMECSGQWKAAAPCRLVVEGGQRRQELSVTTERRPLELELAVPPGGLTVRFTCDGPRVKTADGGRVAFRVWDFSWRVEE